MNETNGMTHPDRTTHGPSLAIGPANYAEQATMWTRSVRRSFSVPAWSFTRSESFSFSADRRLETSGSTTRCPSGSPGVARVLGDASHVALDGFLPLSGGRFSASLTEDVRELLADGRVVSLIAHGSDVRNPVRHARRLRTSWFRTSGAPYFARSLRVALRNDLVRRRLDVPLFVSTPDLLHDLPHARWLPLTVEPERYEGAPPALTGGHRVRVLHQPSLSRPAIKGSSVIIDVLRRLDAEGVVELVAPGRMPHEDFIQVVKSVDVVVDQILSDSYGATSVEAMAAGRLAIASVLDTRERLPMDVPVVDATPDDFERVVRAVASHPARYADRAAAGPAYVRAVHGGELAARELGAWLGLPTA